jgi:DNA helicase-2/ATP-dependent DNA helicase PcrA
MLRADPSPEAESKLGNLQELMAAAADAAARGESMEEFLDHAALVSDADQVDETAPVSLLTMHNAKGLEFPVVFIAGSKKGCFRTAARAIARSNSRKSGGCVTWP